MRIWSVHPKYLDNKGLGGVWRETLLAKAVFEGKTKGYTRHPQLNRFRDSSTPAKYISNYLQIVHNESINRGYKYDSSKVGEITDLKPLPVTRGQLEYEWSHLLKKLKTRTPELHKKFSQIELPDTHPIFVVVEGGIENWEVLDVTAAKTKNKKRKSPKIAEGEELMDEKVTVKSVVAEVNSQVTGKRTEQISAAEKPKKNSKILSTVTDKKKPNVESPPIKKSRSVPEKSVSLQKSRKSETKANEPEPLLERKSVKLPKSEKSSGERKTRSSTRIKM